MKRRQRGLAMVEFALVGPVAFIVLFGCIEIGRALFVWNTVVEATRRGARVAVVTTCDNTGRTAVQDAVLAYGNLDGMKRADITVTYSAVDGSGPLNASSCGTGAFVTVSVSGQVSHPLLIPFLNITLTIPPFSTTLPTESLGVVPS